jgi:CRISPR-associated protein Csm3
MHDRLLNEMVFELALRPRGPLLIKSGDGGSLWNPATPDMSFVRMPGPEGGTPFIPGSSLKGALRAHVERLLRSHDDRLACDPLGQRSCSRTLQQHSSRPANQGDEGPPRSAMLYAQSCASCRLFGNTRLMGRVTCPDLLPDGPTRSHLRFHVAIDRRTGGAARGSLFELEALHEGTFLGEIRLVNFTLGQLGVLAAALLDLADGHLTLGYGKSRGFGAVAVTFSSLRYWSPSQRPGKEIAGVESLLPKERLSWYSIEPDAATLPIPEARQEERLGLRLTVEEGAADFLEQAAELWPARMRP